MGAPFFVLHPRPTSARGNRNSSRSMLSGRELSGGCGLDLARHIQVLLRNAARVVGRQHASHLGITDVDIGMVLRRLGRLCNSRDEGDPSGKGLELKRF